MKNSNPKRNKMAIKRSEMKCPECGRTVKTDEVVCPECGNIIDDTELLEPFDEEQEFSDSFEEEYQNMYQDEDPYDEEDEEALRTFRNLHTDEEMESFDNIISGLRGACKMLEDKHIELKHLYRTRKCLDDDVMQSFAGCMYTKHCKKARGIHWLRSILNYLNRGIPVDWIADWDAEYFKRVLGWLGYDKAIQQDILQQVEAW